MPTLSGSDKLFMRFVDQMTTIDFAVLPTSLHVAKWKQFTHNKNAIYEIVKHNYACEPFPSPSPFTLSALTVIGEWSFLDSKYTIL